MSSPVRPKYGRSLIIFGGIIVASLAAFVVSGIETKRSEIELAATELKGRAPIQEMSMPFISAGDRLGAMTVVSAQPFNTGQYSADPKMMEMGPQNIRIALKGPIEVTGSYEAVHSGIGFDGYCMSDFDTASLSRLPSLPVPGGSANVRDRFCFRNADFARATLGEKSRTITVKMDNYELNSYPAEVVDWADLVAGILPR